MSFISDNKNELLIGAAAITGCILFRGKIRTVLAKIDNRKCIKDGLIFHNHEYARNYRAVRREPFADKFSLKDKIIFECNVQHEMDNVRIFQPTIGGEKPACILTATFKDLHFLEKGKYNTDIDFVHLPPHKYSLIRKCRNTYVLNRNEVFKVIDRNKEIYTNRLNLPEDSGIETIYEKLKQSLKLASGIYDIEGITLGFPKHNSMIHHLENVAGITLKTRKNPEEFKRIILETLHSADSPYKNLSEKEIKDLEKTIGNIEYIQGTHNLIYDFVKYADEPAEFERIRSSVCDYSTRIKYEC